MMSSNISRLFVAGLIATLVITMMMYFVAPMMIGQKMDVAEMLGSMMGNNWGLGMAMHLMLGIIIFPLVYAYILFSYLPGKPVIKGLFFGLILWLLLEIMVMPMMGHGFFSSKAGGMMAVMASLLGHIAYGLTLGGIAGNVQLKQGS